MSHSADWESMWAAGLKPGDAFDMRKSHPRLQALVAAGRVPEGRALVPGCGRGYDVAALGSPTRSAVGWDISMTGVASANEYLRSVAAVNATVEVADFFDRARRTDATPFDFVYDYTFLCALLPSRRHEWAASMHALIRPGGLLMTMQYPLQADDAGPLNLERGPPFTLSRALYRELLPPAGFVWADGGDVPHEESDPRRAGREAWALWKRL